MNRQDLSLDCLDEVAGGLTLALTRAASPIGGVGAVAPAYSPIGAIGGVAPQIAYANPGVAYSPYDYQLADYQDALAYQQYQNAYANQYANQSYANLANQNVIGSVASAVGGLLGGGLLGGGLLGGNTLGGIANYANYARPAYGGYDVYEYDARPIATGYAYDARPATVTTTYEYV